MSDPRPSARDMAHAILLLFGLPCDFIPKTATDSDGWTRFAQNHCRMCNDATSAIEADRAASDAREDRLRRALERIRDGSCDCPEVDAEPEVSHFDLFNCHRTIAAKALAAIPRSDQ